MILAGKPVSVSEAAFKFVPTTLIVPLAPPLTSDKLVGLIEVIVGVGAETVKVNVGEVEAPLMVMVAPVAVAAVAGAVTVNVAAVELLAT